MLTRGRQADKRDTQGQTDRHTGRQSEWHVKAQGHEKKNDFFAYPFFQIVFSSLYYPFYCSLLASLLVNLRFFNRGGRGIGFSDLVDLWVKTPMILCARSMSRSSEQTTKRRSRSENMGKVCLFYGQNNKILSLSNMADTVFVFLFLRNSRGAQRSVGLFFFRTLIDLYHG